MLGAEDKKKLEEILGSKDIPSEKDILFVSEELKDEAKLTEFIAKTLFSLIESAGWNKIKKLCPSVLNIKLLENKTFSLLEGKGWSKVGTAPKLKISCIPK